MNTLRTLEVESEILKNEINVEEEQEEFENLDFDIKQISDIVVYGTDWTAETIKNQIIRKNINLNPKFQRRDAWTIKRKSRLIESLILGLPVPQIVLAEKEKGKYLVLDGKQRLLTILQFYGKSESDNNNFKLKDLEFLVDLNGLRYKDFQETILYSDKKNALDNQTIRTTIIKNWQNDNFLYTVFLRLNVENTPLSPQELRQALHPGEFTNYIDDYSLKSKGLKILFPKQPDFRMRDNQLLLKYIAFRYFLPEYRSDLKAFLDNTCDHFNKQWQNREEEIKMSLDQFEKAIDIMTEIFGEKYFGRVWLAEQNKYERQRNLSVLDAMLFYFSNPNIRSRIKEIDKKDIEDKFKYLCSSSQDFLSSVRSSTSKIRSLYTRLNLWGTALKDTLKIDFPIPKLIDNHISYSSEKRGN
ncbi:protein of unknown function DUF262 [Cyanobacterium stanieri PCC 7202]|uniref:GmrSD restriction endonucleases N-terminal domain-containing protein n=1 Tax=Cyanobacterium stanieri (strain ATCC 29140 / PCC 7202) TaxID=292563 RepID=K9YJ43_CYASC|nr:protein of unknown function DUF262 [Cyanobacterium stanieri PCC 7202]